MSARRRAPAPTAPTSPRDAARTPRRTGPIEWAIAALVLLAGIAHVHAMRLVFDDAFISFRYAAHLAHGQGLVYNAGERVEGYSNFLWTLVMALVIRLGGQPEWWSMVLGGAAAIGTLALVMTFAARRGTSPAFAGALLAASSCWATWATGGLETAWFTAFVTLGVLALMDALPPPSDLAAGGAVRGSLRALLLSGAAIGLACVTRPDGPLIAASLAVALVVIARRGGLAWRHVAAWAGVVAILVLPHLAFRLAYYGRLFPNTAAVKNPGLSHVGAGLGYLATAVRDLHLELLLAPIAVALLLRTRARGLGTRDAGLLAAAALPFAAYVALTGGDFMPQFRFVAPLLPLVSLVAAAALQGLADRLPARAPAWTGVAMVVAVAGAYAALNLRLSVREQGVWTEGEMTSVGWARQDTRDWLRLGNLLRRVTLPTDTLATTAAGAVPYASGLYTLDMLGLAARDLSQYRRLPIERPGHQLLIEESQIDAHPPQILLGHPVVLDTQKHLGLDYDVRPEWHDAVFGHYDLVGFTLFGKPLRFVGCCLRHDAFDRIVEACRRVQAADSATTANGG